MSSQLPSEIKRQELVFGSHVIAISTLDTGQQVIDHHALGSLIEDIRNGLELPMEELLLLERLINAVNGEEATASKDPM